MGKQCPRPWAEGGERALGRPWPGGPPQRVHRGKRLLRVQRGQMASATAPSPHRASHHLHTHLLPALLPWHALGLPARRWACLPPAATFSGEALTPSWCCPQPSVAPTALRTEPGPDCPPEVSAAGPGLAVPSCHSSSQFSSLAQPCPTLCDPIDCNTPGFPVYHQIPGLAQTPVH